MTFTRVIYFLLLGCYSSLIFAAGADPGVGNPGPKRDAGIGGVFSYAAPFTQKKNGRLFRSPATTGQEQGDGHASQTSFMNGTVLIIYWSLLNPKEGVYDWSKIDEAIKYWNSRGKKVGLSVPLFGPPLKLADSWGGSVISPTPDWIMKQVAAYENDTQIFDHDRIPKVSTFTDRKSQDPSYLAIKDNVWMDTETARWRFPDYWDKTFQAKVQVFISALGKKYNNNPNIAFVRVATGIFGEDNPTTSNSLATGIPGYNTLDWIKWTRLLISTYENNFPNTPLEWDMLRVGWAIANDPAPYGAQSDTRLVKSLLLDWIFASVTSENLVLGFNGLSADSLGHLQAAINGGNEKHAQKYIFKIMMDYEQLGGKVALEAYAPPSILNMRDTVRLASVIDQIKPHRLNTFGFALAVLNKASNQFNEDLDGAAWQTFRAQFPKGKEGEAQSLAEADKQLKFMLDYQRQQQKEGW